MSQGKCGWNSQYRKMCGKLDIPMVYISTDYVFDGQGTRPWEPDDPVVEPLNVYGHSKYEGEVAVEKYAPHYYIVRIAWVFGKNGKNFIKTMLNVAKTHDTLTVVDDQIGTPTYTYDLARLLVDMLEKKNMENIMQQMKADIFPGMILQKRSSVRQEWM